MPALIIAGDECSRIASYFQAIVTTALADHHRSSIREETREQATASTGNSAQEQEPLHVDDDGDGKEEQEEFTITIIHLISKAMHTHNHKIIGTTLINEHLFSIVSVVLGFIGKLCAITF